MIEVGERSSVVTPTKSSEDYFAGLDHDLGPPGQEPQAGTSAEAIDRVSIVNGGNADYAQIPCPKCNGRGFKTYGYVNIKSYPCRMCKETGKVTAKRLARVEGAKKARETKARNLAQKIAAFHDEYKSEVAFLIKAAEWSDFYRAVLENISVYGGLTEKQLEAVRRGIIKQEERRAQRAAERAAAPRLDVSAIEALFNTALANGLKHPVFRAADGVAVSPAPATGRNAGALYVKENGEYVGKIVSGQFQATRAASDKVLPRLQAVAGDPMAEAKLYGKQTGTCGCCGRELTDPVSIEQGIGPICASKWGL